MALGFRKFRVRIERPLTDSWATVYFPVLMKEGFHFCDPKVFAKVDHFVETYVEQVFPGWEVVTYQDTTL
jgi:hypothetical protein